MLSNRLAFAALGIACVTAAAGGGYLANRQHAPTIAATADSIPPLQPVQETEAVVSDQPGQTLASQAEAGPASSTRTVSATRSSQPPDPKRQATSRPAVRTEKTTSVSTSSSNQLPALERSWPSGATPAPPAPEPVATAAQPVETPSPSAREEERAAEPARAPEPPAKTLEELVVSADSVIGLQMETAVTSERARVEDRVDARVVRDVRVGGEVAIPAGSRVIGSVTVVERGGKVKDRARLGIRFHTLVLADGTRLPITTETVYRNGEPPGDASAAKIGGGAAAGAILGAIIGGAKGAAIGGTVGAGAGTAAVMSGDRRAATFPAGTDVTARILSPVTVTIEK